jgi:mannitol 2-dehydrogenase
MVDRITPYTKNSDKFFLQMNYNIIDKVPVIAETYNYWVIENNYSSVYKPNWRLCEEIVETNNIEDYEKTKLLLLNSSHSFLAYLGYLFKDINYVYEASCNKIILEYLNNYMEEVKDSLDLKKTNINKDKYIENTIKRFQNYYIKDEISRIAQDGSQKIKTTLHDCLNYFYNKDINNPPKFVSLLLALFINYMNPENKLISDPLKNELTNNNIYKISLNNIQNHDIEDFFRLILDEKILTWKELIETIKIEYIKIKTDYLI